MATLPAKQIIARLQFCEEILSCYTLEGDWNKENISKFANDFKNCSDAKVRNAAVNLNKKVDQLSAISTESKNKQESENPQQLPPPKPSNPSSRKGATVLSEK